MPDTTTRFWIMIVSVGGLVAALGLCLGLLAPSTQLDAIFHAYINLSGVLIGLGGLVGVFALDSLRRRNDDLDRNVHDIETTIERMRFDASAQNRPDLNSLVAPLERRIETIKARQCAIAAAIPETLHSFLEWFFSSREFYYLSLELRSCRI